MAYQALYRRYRPKTFDEVLGQEHITTILKNQIQKNNIAHAYLFSGIRGTGKTSTAKIFARAVNCIDSNNGNPCNKCEVCKGILENNVMDVVEMDAASNNSVDDIRELREKVKYPPSKGRYKVYIIDEVHMLSKGAFNALLKTLEEPPEHLLFILATTEPQKLPATILSRCQRYDFKRVTTNDIVNNMKNICDDMNIEVQEKALNLIARNADGGMRDALSILDQCVSFADGKITYEYVLSILGTVNNEIVFDMADDIIEKDLENSLKLIDNIVQRGKDIHQFIKDLIVHFRNLMVSKSSDNLTDIIDGTEDMLERFRDQSKDISLNKIISIIKDLSEAEVNSKWSSQPRIILETTLMKIISPKLDTSIAGVLERLNQLENSIRNGEVVSKKSKQDKTIIKDDKKEEPVKTKKITKITDESDIINNEEEKQKERNISSENHSSKEDIDSASIMRVWSDVLKKIKSEKISVQALLSEGKPVNVENNLVIIAFPEGFGFHKDAVSKDETKEYIEKTISNFLNTDVKVKFIMKNELSSNDNEDNTLVDEVIKVFGEDIVEIED